MALKKDQIGLLSAGFVLGVVVMLFLNFLSFARFRATAADACDNALVEVSDVDTSAPCSTTYTGYWKYLGSIYGAGINNSQPSSSVHIGDPSEPGNPAVPGGGIFDPSGTNP